MSVEQLAPASPEQGERIVEQDEARLVGGAALQLVAEAVGTLPGDTVALRTGDEKSMSEISSVAQTRNEIDGRLGPDTFESADGFNMKPNTTGKSVNYEDDGMGSVRVMSETQGDGGTVNGFEEAVLDHRAVDSMFGESVNKSVKRRYQGEDITPVTYTAKTSEGSSSSTEEVVVQRNGTTRKLTGNNAKRAAEILTNRSNAAVAEAAKRRQQAIDNKSN